MERKRKACAAVAAAVMLAAQPAFGFCGPALRVPPGAGVPPASAPDLRRAAVTERLESLGYVGTAARDAAALLTAEDLVVLCANPRMLQRAGTLTQTQVSYIAAALIVGGIVALAVAGDGFVMIN